MGCLQAARAPANQGLTRVLALRHQQPAATLGASARQSLVGRCGRYLEEGRLVSFWVSRQPRTLPTCVIPCNQTWTRDSQVNQFWRERISSLELRSNGEQFLVRISAHTVDQLDFKDAPLVEGFNTSTLDTRNFRDKPTAESQLGCLTGSCFQRVSENPNRGKKEIRPSFFKSQRLCAQTNALLRD
jgi:hypothetical protein